MAHIYGEGGGLVSRGGTITSWNRYLLDMLPAPRGLKPLDWSTAGKESKHRHSKVPGTVVSKSQGCDFYLSTSVSNTTKTIQYKYKFCQCACFLVEVELDYEI